MLALALLIASASCQGSAGSLAALERLASGDLARKAIIQVIGSALDQVVKIDVSGKEKAPAAQAQEPAEPEEPADVDEPDETEEPGEAGASQNVSISIGKDGVHITPIPRPPPPGQAASPAIPGMPAIPPMPPIPPVPPIPPIPPIPLLGEGDDNGGDSELPGFTEKGKGVPVVQVLHRLARTAGWSLTLVGVGSERIDVDFTDADPREALRDILKSSRSMGVLRRDKLIVINASGNEEGMLIESRSGRHAVRQAMTRLRTGTADKADAPGKRDMVKVLQGDLVVPRGTVLSGDAVAIWGSVDIEPGAVVQGSVVAIGGSVNVAPGGVVLGDGVAILGDLDVARGGQVLGEHVQVGLGKLFSRKLERHSSVFSRLGPFGFFPSLAVFALAYLLGLGALRLWPERVRAVGAALLRAPMRSFFVGFLCWLLLVPVVVLLCISLVGIPLVPLLPLVLFGSIGLGLAGLALRVGEALPAGPGQTFVPPAALGMGMLVMLLASFVPWLGTPLLVLLQFVALGSAVSSRYGRALPLP